ncbi:Cyclopropane-fatty-acyl-phospholipid synthase [Rhodoferax ferrireducens T118]|uniref:Cyclopropane-fatty-acyl-phospholipid synthase n=1 Tax=Albidiferax ferrireducens (strain ATCC BAA-621 / DSM 15236 / T118) TaxID=338969 RepID=Q220H7_ALBFT|nr:cyclopropane-fatty-acyl-phospholipid synthase family protein [Rhodoferax ferrireducens]ABD68576.1 Cyclopropane-fatty-acyl-phospholipid synthase [Rhodoferax ferrireducens T118]
MLFSMQNIVDAMQTRTGMSFAIGLPDGSHYRAGPGEPAFTMLFRSDAALLQAFTRGQIGLLESYFDQSVDVEGDFGAALAAGLLSGLDLHGKALITMENGLHELRYSNHSPAQAKANARAHYGLGEAFYRLWLDEPLMMYTCGYWFEGTQTLEQAQQRKIDHVCRKIRLARGERFVDIGCGFGGFMFRAWETLGAIGTGINTTTEQVDWLRSEITRRGLDNKLSVREADFRAADAQYDKVVSIGVLEHAGRDQLAAVIQAHADFLKPGGLGLLHFIGHVGPRETDLFIRKHVFPGGWIPGLSEVVVEMERCGLEVLDIENLRRHYALTLDEWARRFEAQWETIRALDPQRFDERFYRVWRTYLIGCAEMFRSPGGYTHLFQIVFSKGNVTPASFPMSRAYLYDA